MENITEKTGRQVSCIALCALCLLPSILINIQARMDNEGNIAIATTCGMSVVVAALALLIVEKSAHYRQYQRLFWCLPLFIVLFIFNLSNAIGLAGQSRTFFVEQKNSAAKQVEDYTKRLSTLNEQYRNLTKDTKGKPASAFQAELSALEQSRIFLSPARSNRCKNATAEESINLCGRWRSLKVMVPLAKKAETLARKIQFLQEKLDALPKAKHMETHPHVQAMLNVWGVIFPANAETQRLIAIVNDLLLGFVIEIIAGFGPTLMTILFWPVKSEVKANSKTKQRSVVKNQKVDPVQQFMTENITSAPGRSLSAKAVHKRYCDWCSQNNIVPVSNTVFGRKTGQYARRKVKGRVQYVNVGWYFKLLQAA